jgi:hypothetical protein
MHIFGWPHQDFELDQDLAPDPHQNNADPQPWAQLSKDCCLIYNYVWVNTKEQQAEEKCCYLCFLMYDRQVQQHQDGQAHQGGQDQQQREQGGLEQQQQGG